MSKLTKLLITVGAVAGVILVAVSLSRRGGQGPEPEALAPAIEPASPAETNRFSSFAKRPRRPSVPIAAASQPAAGSVTATTNTMSEWSTAEIHTLLPFMTHSSPSHTARVLIAPAGSAPPLGSVWAKQKSFSPDNNGSA